MRDILSSEPELQHVLSLCDGRARRRVYLMLLQRELVCLRCSRHVTVELLRRLGIGRGTLRFDAVLNKQALLRVGRI